MCLTLLARCLEKPICRRVSKGLKFCVRILVGVGFLRGGRAAAILSSSPPLQRRYSAHIHQCFGKGTGTAGTATFYFSRTGAVMQSGSETRFGPRSNTKCNTKVKKSRIRGKFLGNNAACTIEKARFFKKILCC